MGLVVAMIGLGALVIEGHIVMKEAFEFMSVGEKSKLHKTVVLTKQSIYES